MNYEKLRKKQFLHFRFYDSERNICANGGYTICYIPKNESETSSIGISKCSWKDRYRKKTGRLISEERAKNGISSKKRNIHIDIPSLLSYSELIEIGNNTIKADIENKQAKYKHSHYSGKSILLKNKQKKKNS